MGRRIVGTGLALAAAVVCISIVAAARSDLIVSSLEVRPPVPFPGTVATLVAVIENAGDGRFGSSVSVRFFVDGEEFASSTIVGGMEARDQREVSASWIAEEGPHILTVDVDEPFNRVPESRETNNSASITVFVPFASTSSEAVSGVRVAVAEFADRSRAGFVNVGAGVADELAGRLSGSGLVVVKRGELEAILQERSLNPFLPENLILAARELGVDLVIAGAVDSVDVAEITLNLGIVRFSSAAVDVRASAQVVDVQTGVSTSSVSAKGREEGATGVSVDLTGFLALANAYDVCGGGLRSDDAEYSVGETVPIGYANDANGGWFSVEIYTASNEFLGWLGWRFIGTGECGKWFWDQRDALGAQVGPGLYTAKLWNGDSYAAAVGFQIRPGGSASAPPVGEITVGTEAFDRTIAGMAVHQVVDQLAASVLSAVASNASRTADGGRLLGAASAAAEQQPALARSGQVAATLPDGRVAINIGSSSGVAVGDRFEILAVENLVSDPQSLEILGFDVTAKKGEIEIVEVHDRVSYGVRTSDFEPSIGDVARWIGP
ncbi:MAG: CARDB domain-containing protein [Thermotogota bacterium]